MYFFIATVQYEIVDNDYDVPRFENHLIENRLSPFHNFTRVYFFWTTLLINEIRKYFLASSAKYLTTRTPNENPLRNNR